MLWTYLWKAAALYHMESSSADSSGNGKNWTDTAMAYNAASARFWVWGCHTTSTSSAWIDIPTTTLWTIGTGDFTFSCRIYWAAPAANCYPSVLTYQGSSWAQDWPYVVFDPLDCLWLGIWMICRVWGTNKQIVTFSSASAMYWYWMNVIFTRVSGQCSLYINWKLGVTFSDATSIPVWYYTAIFSRESTPAETTPEAMLWDEFILESSAITSGQTGWSQSKVSKYYTAAKWRFGII